MSSARTLNHNTQLERLARSMVLLVLSVLFLLPVVWMFLTSIKPGDQVFAPGFHPLPEPVSDAPRLLAENYTAAWNNEIVDFPQALRNSLIVCVLSVTGMVISSSIAAFGFSRVRWPGRGLFFALVLVTLMVPYPVLMGSLYVLFKELGWIGTFRPLWVPAWFGGAFQIFLLRQFFLTLPRELDEAATIDGCSQIGVFVRIVLPLSYPALAVVALFQFTYAWNDFLAPLIFLNHRDQFTLALGLQMYQSQQGNTPWNQLMAASMLVTLPVLVLFLFTQRTFVEGIATQGLKS
ncbi:MAG: multiple sugar transport system permease protein [Phycisphaerales bacterium]|jgi:multiple sugar transport system permease protein